jgi:hypothetical protein
MSVAVLAEQAPKVTQGLYTDVSSEAYHKGPGRSASDIIAINKYGFDGWQYRKQHPKEADSLTLGSATHLLLEARLKDDFLIEAQGIAIVPALNMRTNAGKEQYAAFVAANAGKMILDQEDYDHARRMVDAVQAEPDAWEYLQGGLSEPSIYVHHPEHEILLKCRPDYLRMDDGLSINFKTTKDASESGFIKSIRDYSNDWQSAYYMEVLEIFARRSFNEIHLLVEKTPDGGPCRVGLYTIPDEVIAYARVQFQPILKLLKQYEQTGELPRRQVTLNCPTIPNYAVTKGMYV